MSSDIAFPAPGARDHLALGLVSGAVIAYELFVMRVFANGGWAHFGSTVVSIALFGFGVLSALLCLWGDRFTRRLETWLNITLLALGPAMILANVLGQRIPFNPMFLVSDPGQKYRLALLFLVYFIPFLVGALYIGLAFTAGRAAFGRVYFANMAGSGLGGVVLFLFLFLVTPRHLFLAPILVWAAGAVCRLWGRAGSRSWAALALGLAAALGLGFGLPQVVVSPYKGVSYARNFPDANRQYEAAGPFGYLEIFSSSYFHFAPGLSDTASLHLKEMPKNAFWGMYIDGDGPIGLMKRLPESQAEYFRFLPVAMPYLVKAHPRVLIMALGGGISTNVALGLGADRVDVAEGNPMMVRAVRDDSAVSTFTGKVLADPRVRVIETEGRIAVRQARDTYDLVDLSLSDSTGLSMAGGSSIYEKYGWTRETLASCLDALAPGGILAITVWNKEDPPKSTLKLLRTAAEAARERGEGDPGRSFYVCHTYLSTLTILYKKGGFNPAETETLDRHCRRMSFTVLYRPGQASPGEDLKPVLSAFRDLYFNPEALQDNPVDMTADHLYKLAAHALLAEKTDPLLDGYIFDNRALTDDRPYLAGYVRPADIPRFLPLLETINDEWGYLLLWATLLLALVFGLLLMLFPVVFGWRAVFSRTKGKMGIVIYFICLGLGYILVEIALIAKLVQVLGNPTVSVAVLIPGMLVFSGIGSWFSDRVKPNADRAMAVILPLAGISIVLSAWGFSHLAGLVGAWPYGLKILVSLMLLFPMAFLMGFPFALGMSSLADRGKNAFFIWAWGINGSFSVVGSVLAPILAVLFGLKAVLILAAGCYLLALPSFYWLRVRDQA